MQVCLMTLHHANSLTCFINETTHARACVINIYPLTWYKIFWLFLDLSKIWFLTVATLKTIMGLFCIIWDMLSHGLAKWHVRVYTSTLLLLLFHCQSAIEQTSLVKVQCTPTVQVASVAKSKGYIIMFYSFFQNPTWPHPVKKDF